MRRQRLLVVVSGLVLLTAALARITSSQPRLRGDDWPSYGHDAGGMRYSPLTQITRENVSRLTVAWTYHTGDISDGQGGRNRSGFETTPIVVDGTMFLTTPFNRIVALDPETGVKKWTFDPSIDRTADYGDGLISRGVATWLDARLAAGRACRRRIFEATLDARLVAVDAANGTPCSDFGEKGQVSLRDVAGYRPGWYHMTSPPAVVDDLVVVGSAIDDNTRSDMPAGVVRAFDARSGTLRWSWDPIPASTPRVGAANAWSVMAVDAERHLVFVPTGSASPDYYGGGRPGDDRWANSIVALHAGTGTIAWAFQLVHHDLWDYDSAAPPLLATLTRGGARVPVVIQGNKTGFVYVLHRETGAPVFPVEERAVPASDVPGEHASPTQPFPSAPPPLAPQRWTEAWGATAADREACEAAVRGLRNEGLFTPPSVAGSIVVPGNVGGMNWSGSAFDPARNLLVVNTNNIAAKVRLIPRDAFASGKREEDGEYGAQTGTPYGLFRRLLQAPSGLPCAPPPWGTLAAVDLAAGTIRWQVPLGTMFGAAEGLGSVSLGGPITTAGGLVFIAGTIDPFLRVFDIDTGRELWKGRLPANGHATPMTYQSGANGRQFVVVAAGGHAKITEERLDDSIVAFAIENPPAKPR